YDSTRVSLGLFQHDVNVIWDLAPHDFSIIDYLMDAKPVALSAHGVDHFGRGHINLAYITAYYDNNLLVHINVNWLSPVKVRTTLIGGEKKMLVWDDLETDEKIKIYDKGVSLPTKEGQYKLMVDYRSGDMYSPRVEQTEALKKELLYFIECVEKKKTPINDGRSGLRIVQLLEMTDQSLKNNGAMVKVNEQEPISAI
ncbi:MAG: gfo/Idh/MocA family oxidoreductase, partial [Candidatus Omnitrophica bacterium]|nr:gfo/Idh/MocA family oxidoreductase [Candidatus Omnitrophota bacterium]